MNQKLDLTRPVQMSDGRKARIICSNRESSLSVVALVKDLLEGEAVIAFDAFGFSNYFRLVNVPEKIEGWVNVYSHGACGTLYPSKEVALKSGFSNKIACVSVSFNKGDGLE